MKLSATAHATISGILSKARTEGRSALLETEGMRILSALEIPTARFVELPPGRGALGRLEKAPFTGPKAVVKVVSHEILHKSDLGGVALVDNNPAAIDAALLKMIETLEPRYSVQGYSVSEFVPYSASLGNELLFGVRRTEDFGPVLTVGAGGITTEFLSEHFKTGRDVVLAHAALYDPARLAQALSALPVIALTTKSHRGQAPKLALSVVREIAEKLAAFAVEFGHEVSEFEVNPFVVSEGRLIALDALVKLGAPVARPNAPRPLAKIEKLLKPRSAAVIGVSEKMNPGHIILNNLIAEGFDRSHIYVIKPGLQELEGCRCVESIAALPEKVDLLILSVSAAQVPGIVTEVTETQKAESLIVIPGGLEEKAGTEQLVHAMNTALARSRATPWGGPVINGGNCLGIRSEPGRYNTMFIPEHKLPIERGHVSPVAFLSQSGAFGISRTNKLPGISPKYSISMGNQMDLTVGDYLAYLKEDPGLKVFAIYVEGFKPLDGERFLRAAREITGQGRRVILYRAGRTAEGAQASASHTASIAGNYAVTRQLCAQAGVTVAETIEDFERLVRLFVSFESRPLKGTRLGAISNAGFECVAFADNLGCFKLQPFAEKTGEILQEVFKKAGISEIVDIHNPVDLTPMGNGEAYEKTIETVLADPAIDVALIGCVPLTSALQTLAPAPGVHREDLNSPDGFATRMKTLFEKTAKPCVVVVDAGPLYDSLVQTLEAAGMPTFRTADHALRLLNQYAGAVTSTG